MITTATSAEIRGHFGAFLNAFDAHAPRPLDADHLGDFCSLLLQFAEDVVEATCAEQQPLPVEQFDELVAVIEQAQDRLARARTAPPFYPPLHASTNPAAPRP